MSIPTGDTVIIDLLPAPPPLKITLAHVTFSRGPSIDLSQLERHLPCKTAAAYSLPSSTHVHSAQMFRACTLIGPNLFKGRRSGCAS